MESLLSVTYPKSKYEDSLNTINLDISCIDENIITEDNIDISKANALELSDLIVSDMLKHIKKDLSSIRVSEKKRKKK